MKTVLIVDDERPVIDGMQLIIKRDLSDKFTIAGSAMSGRDALEKVHSLNPDLVLMDIHMPGMSGIDTIRELKKRNSSAIFILVTAYERFDIAQEAVGLGVFAYLTKPVTRERLIKAMTEAWTLMTEKPESPEKEQPGKHNELLSAWAEIILIQGIVLGQNLQSSSASFLDILGFESQQLCMAAISIRERGIGVSSPEPPNSDLAEQIIKTLRFKTTAVVGPVIGGLLPLCLPIRSSVGSSDVAGKMLAVIQQNFPEELKRGVILIGIGTVQDLSRASESWAAAVRNVLVSGSVHKSGEVSSACTEVDDAYYLFEEEQNFLSAVRDGDRMLARLSLEKLLQPYTNIVEVPISDRYQFIGLIIMVLHDLYRQKRLEKQAMVSLMVMEDLRNAHTGNELINLVRSRWLGLMEEVRHAPRWSPSVAIALEKIKNNFSDQLSLENVASDAGISPSRLSRLFIEETGNAFSEQLISVRIDHAKALLKIPGASIKQVSVACGYLDPNYFARLFKKHTGLTPSAYAEGTIVDDDHGGLDDF